MADKVTRRSALRKIAGTAALAGAPAILSSSSQAAPPRRINGQIKHSVSKWCYPDLSIAELAEAGKEFGLQSIELLGPEDWPAVKEHGLTCAMCNGPGSIEEGFNRLENHDELVPAYEERIHKVAEAGFTNLICFSGNREEGLSDEEGMENCARGLKQITPVAEERGVVLVMELLNSKVNHPGYMCDHTDWGVALCEMVGSDNFKLLYDIYHMQIMEGDVIRTIRNNHEYFAHYHTAGVPGRHEIDETQELYYPAIVRAIEETGYEGFLGQEFVPTKDPLASLENAIDICTV